MSEEKTAPFSEISGKGDAQAFEPPKEKNFAEHLKFHLRNGTRPDGTPGAPGREWSDTEFAIEIQKIRKPRPSGANDAGDAFKNLTNWLRGANVCKDKTWADAIEKALFSENKAYGAWRLRLREARATRPQEKVVAAFTPATTASELDADHKGPFREIRWDEKFPRIHPYAPTSEEFVGGMVVRPQITDEVVKQLQHQRWAIVLGRGASGKTILGYLLSLDNDLRPKKSFYLDIGRFQHSDFVGEISGKIFKGVGSGELLILDNVHLNEDLASDIWHEWSKLAEQPYFVLLGRELRRRDGSRFGSQVAKSQILLARESEIRGVFARLATRRLIEIGATPLDVPVVPEHVVSQWMLAFGGLPAKKETTVDLMMLSVAIRRKIDSLLEHRWTLSVSDARDEVRRNYLAVTEGERRNLARLSMLPDDFRLPRAALFDSGIGFRQSIERGIVFESDVSAGALTYRFAHAALGRLIADALGPTFGLVDELKQIAHMDSKTAYYISERYVLDQKIDDGRKLLKIISDNPDWLNQFEGHAGHLVYLVRALSKANLIHDEKLSDIFRRSPTALARIMVASSCTAILTFLGTAGELDLRKAASIALSALSRNAEELVRISLEAPFDQLPTFLLLLNSLGLEQERRKLLAKLASEESVGVFARRACKEKLQGFVRFLEIEELAEKVVSKIDRHEWEVARVAIGGQPDFFIAFAGNLRRLGRPELATVPAKREIEDANPEYWRELTIRHLSNMFAVAAPTTAEQQRRFLNRVVTAPWLDKQFQQASVGTLVGSLLSILVHFDRSNWAIFVRPSLQKRANEGVLKPNTANPESCARGISLFGLSRLICGADQSPTHSNAWDSHLLEEVISTIAPSTTQSRITLHQLQLWLGIRELVKSHHKPLRLSEETGAAMLSVLYANLPYAGLTEHYTMQLIDWLEGSRRQGWSLVKQ